MRRLAALTLLVALVLLIGLALARPAAAQPVTLNVSAELAGSIDAPSVAISAISSATPGTAARLYVTVPSPLRLDTIGWAGPPADCQVKRRPPQWVSCTYASDGRAVGLTLGLTREGPAPFPNGVPIFAYADVGAGQGMARVWVALPAPRARLYLPLALGAP